MENRSGIFKRIQRALVKNKIDTPLNQPLVLQYEDKELELDLASIGFSINTDLMVESAHITGQSQFVLFRMFRRLLGKPLNKNIPLIFDYDRAKLEQYISDLAKHINYDPRSAYIDMSSGSPKISPSRTGLTVDEQATLEIIHKALPAPKRRIQMVAESVSPELTEQDINYIIVIRLSEHTLYLYDSEYLDDSYIVAVGSDRYPTPTGKYHITYKEKDPTWLPISAWAENQGVPVPPGPDNPLGKYWMDLGRGIGIHATPYEESLGRSVSHGCIRMSTWAAEQLFDTVMVGTPVFIIN